jgi:hypothetical protein
MAAISDLRPIYSGGATNDIGDASLGGQISTATGKYILGQSTSALVNVTGVVINDAVANSEGSGTLVWVDSSDQLGWTAPGTGTAYYVTVTGNGDYVIGSPAGYLYVTVTQASLPTSNKSDSVTVTTRSNELFDNISATEALVGDVEYRCFYLKNCHATDTMTDVKVWVRQQPTGYDDMDIALDPAGNGNGSTTGVAIGPLANEQDSTNLLSGLSWSRPATQVSGLTIGSLTAGLARAIWIRRTIPADTLGRQLNDQSKIGFSAVL